MIEFLIALNSALADHWTIFVQPHLNGLRPDFVIFSPQSGLGIIEVSSNVMSTKGRWSESTEPLVETLAASRRTLFENQLALLYRQALTDAKAFAAISTYIYFARDNHPEIDPKRKYVSVVGHGDLEPNRLRAALHMPTRSRFASTFSQPVIMHGLRIALGYPEHEDLNRLLALEPTPEQRRLMPNDLGRSRRVVGAAGSGKTLLAAWKAVNGAAEGKNVFLTCFNITMANHLFELVTCLSQQHGPHVHRYIEVQHFHAAFMSSRGRRHSRNPIDILLVDEGQDFEGEWIRRMFTDCRLPYHFMFFEDERQNVYGVDSRKRLALTGTGVKGRPNILRCSHRVPLLNRACESLDLTNAGGSTDEAKEQNIVAAFIKRVEPSPQFDKWDVAELLRTQNGFSLANIFATGGLMTLLSAGGFATYVAMSTALGAATATLGVTLPFAAYATASTALAVALGPIGWIASHR